MYRDGHIGVNALLYAPVALLISYRFSVGLAAVGAFIVVGVASAPDLDRHFDKHMNTNKSDLWTVIPISHRGLTHTVWFGLIVGIVVGGLAGAFNLTGYPNNHVAALGFGAGFLGIVGHILGDMVTPMGVQPFSPLSRREYSLSLFKASSTIANRGASIAGGFALLGAFGYAVSEIGVHIDTFELVSLLV